jgi:hypothetical protein
VESANKAVICGSLLEDSLKSVPPLHSRQADLHGTPHFPMEQSQRKAVHLWKWFFSN